MEPTVVVGRVVKPHGVRGELVVEVRSDNPDRYANGASMFTEEGRELSVLSTRRSGGKLLVSFVGVGDRDAAESLRGAMLVVPESWLPELPEGEWWPHQLEGCRVVTESGRDLGTLTEVIPNPANDIWVARDEVDHETLIPALKDLLVDVDVAEKAIVVRDVPGITLPETP